MSEVKSESAAVEAEKPVFEGEEVKFPPFPDPGDNDFEEDIGEEERNHYKDKFKDLNIVKGMRLHCSACDRHLGCSARTENRMRQHPMLRTLVCNECHTFYNSGEFEKGDDGSELYCRWCGQGGQVYCCSDCPHVFCAKCIKRNFGTPKIREIENTDDWKCFKCNSRPLWDLRATCWALLRFCDLKNKITYKTQDAVLKEAYQKDCIQDYSECCKNKLKRREKIESAKKKEVDNVAKSKAAAVISRIPPTIQVKKFASINLDETIKPDKKPQKRSISPKNKAHFMKNPIAIASRLMTPVTVPNMAKKMRMNPPPMINTIRFSNDRKPMPQYSRIRPKPPQINPMFNGFTNSIAFHPMPISDNINLSLESLTQGLDMSAVAAMATNSQDDDVVCTPDFPMEPLCEVTEDNTDDDVQCITPGPVAAPKPPPLVSRNVSSLPDLTSENIIQMTENDVTVNAATGGLKFRVDPQTLSSNKMYRLPDGRIFAINANPTMPGGYSATIVAVTESNTGKSTPKGSTFAAKLSSVSTSGSSSPSILKTSRKNQTLRISKHSTPKGAKVNRGTETPSRECDLNVPVEWYRYNLIDAIDALEYSLSRLHKLRKEATTMHLRTRSVSEMRNLHKSLERLLNTSSVRFNEIRESLDKEFKQYLLKKTGGNVSDDDDDVEILPDLDENDDPIFIDENSVDSNVIESQEVDLTGHISSDHNDSIEKSPDKSVKDTNSKLDKGSLDNELEANTISIEHSDGSKQNMKVNKNEQISKDSENEQDEDDGLNHKDVDTLKCNTENVNKNENDTETKAALETETESENKNENESENEIENSTEKDIENESGDVAENRKIDTNGDIEHHESMDTQDSEKNILESEADNLNCETDVKGQDTELTDEMVETLLKDDQDETNIETKDKDIPCENQEN